MTVTGLCAYNSRFSSFRGPIETVNKGCPIASEQCRVREQPGYRGSQDREQRGESQGGAGENQRVGGNGVDVRGGDCGAGRDIGAPADDHAGGRHGGHSGDSCRGGDGTGGSEDDEARARNVIGKCVKT